MGLEAPTITAPTTDAAPLADAPTSHEKPGINRVIIVGDIISDPRQGRNGLSPTIHGVNVTLGNITKELNNRGIIVDYVVGSDFASREHRFPGIDDYDFPELTDTVKKSVEQRLMQNRPDAAIIVPEGILSPYILKLCRKLGIPTIAFYTTDLANSATPRTADIIQKRLPKSLRRGVEPIIKYPIQGAIDAYTLYLYSRADAAVVPTPKIARHFLRIGIDPYVIPRGINKELFKPAEQDDKNPYEDKEWYNPDRPIILCPGRITAEKRYKELVEYAKQHPEMDVVFAGEINRKEEEYFTLALGKNSNIHYIGSLPQKELVRYYQFAGVVVVPSAMETYGHISREALLTGAPVVALKGQPTAEPININKGRIGFTYKKGNLKQLHDGIISALNLPRGVEFMRWVDEALKGKDWKGSVNLLYQLMVDLKEERLGRFERSRRHTA